MASCRYTIRKRPWGKHFPFVVYDKVDKAVVSPCSDYDDAERTAEHMNALLDNPAE